MSELTNPSFARWLTSREACWAEAWAEALRSVSVDFGAMTETEREVLGRKGAHAFVARMVGGEEQELASFCEGLSRLSLERRVSVADQADALDAGRATLVSELAASKMPQKVAARDFVERTFRLALRHLLDSLGQGGQQEVQLSLERTQELLRNILDSSVSAIVSTDTSGRITLANRTAVQLFGLQEHELLGTPVVRRYAGGRTQASRIIREMLKHGALRDWEMTLVGADGQPVPVRLTASLLRDKGGGVVGTMGFAQDISVEESLRRDVANRNGYLLSILHGSADGLVIVNADGRVASWNRGASQLMGVRPEEALGRPLEELFDPAKVRPLAETAGGPNESKRFEYRVEAPGGGHDLLVSRTEITGTGEPGASIVLKDVTELKLLQRELAEAEHLAELGRLAASIAHEIKNPIAGLRGAMEMMGGVHAEQDPRFAVFREALMQIRRLDALVKDLLAYARPVRIKTEPVPVYLLVEAALLLVRDPLSEAKLTLESAVSEDLPALQVDPILIQQVLVNLLMNAIQATPAGGVLSITAQAVPNGSVTVGVSDTGCGIRPEVQENIFKPFFTTKHVGTGLGLSIVQRLLRAHGGYCEVTSKHGKGTTFTVHLPTGVGRS